MNNTFYTYIYLDPRKPGRWEYKNWVFLYEPMYIGKGMGDRINNHLQTYKLRKGSIFSRKLTKILALSLKPIRFRIFENLKEDEAFEEEVKAIAFSIFAFFNMNEIFIISQGFLIICIHSCFKRTPIFQCNFIVLHIFVLLFDLSSRISYDLFLYP